MYSRVCSAVEKNAEYDEALADGYDRLINEASGGKKDHSRPVIWPIWPSCMVRRPSSCAMSSVPTSPSVIGQAVANRKIRRQRIGRLN